MSYHERLHPWCILRFLPKMKWLIVARFRRRNDAEGHLKALCHLDPTIEYEIAFDPGLAQSDSTEQKA
jgi:hypothetical protein